VKVEIGGGPIPLEGYFNIDCLVHPKVNHVMDFNVDKLPFENDSVDEIYSSHCLEHLDPVKGYVHCLEEMYRVSKPDAKWLIKVPYAHSHHTIANPFHINNRFNEYAFSFFSGTHKPCGNTLVRKGSISETWILCTVEVEKIEFGYFPDFKYLENRSEEEQQIARHRYWNVVDEIKYHIRVVKPDFWTQERKRLGLI
jgi:SAM-dependent methyltransferase